MTLTVEVDIMKRNPWIFGMAAGLWCLAGVSLSAFAQRNEGLPAREALDILAKRFGEDRIEWVVEMRGFDGIPEPPEWEVYIHDPSTRYLTREYWVGDREATNEGASDDFFPDRSPFGYFRVAELKLDSKAAFTIAEAEARKARVGFDKLNYFLRCREFSREPIWMLELIDASNDLVGKVYISGENGEVLRTVWVLRGSRGRPDGGPLVLDSAAPRPEGGASEGARSQSNSSGGQDPNSLKKFTPEEPDPLQPPGRLPPMPKLEPTPEPSPSPNPPSVPPAPGTGTDTRIPPPPLPPAP